MKLYPRLISSAARSLFGRSSLTPRHTLAPRALADGPLFPARDFDTSTVLHTPVPYPSLIGPFLCWLAGLILVAVYFVWFFSDLLPQSVR